MREIAAIHSYAAIASPIAYPDPDIAMKCSAEILAAIRAAPIIHHGKVRPARK